MNARLDTILSVASAKDVASAFVEQCVKDADEVTSFERRFVNSVKARQSRDKRNPKALYMTRFHNLTRLLMYNIV